MTEETVGLSEEQPLGWRRVVYGIGFFAAKTATAMEAIIEAQRLRRQTGQPEPSAHLVSVQDFPLEYQTQLDQKFPDGGIHEIPSTTERLRELVTSSPSYKRRQ